MIAHFGATISICDHLVRKGSDTFHEEMVNCTMALFRPGEIGESIILRNPQQDTGGLHLEPCTCDVLQERIPIAAGNVPSGQLAVDLGDSVGHYPAFPARMPLV